MSIYNLDKVFKPKTLAVIGASEKEKSIGHVIVDNLEKSGYKGKTFPVNPRYKSVCGLPSYPALKDIGSSIDLAVIATPIITIPSIIKECAETGVGGAIVIAAGGKETGKKGRKTEAEIKRTADAAGIRIIGPNCLGIICSGSKLNASFASHNPLPGNLAFISQSGAICTAALDLSLKERIGFSHFISIGSMLDVDFGDLIDYLGHDPLVSSIVLYIESLSNIRKFMSAARSVSRIKPIAVLKSGKSKAGAKAAASHTGAMAGEDAVYDAAFKRAGLVRIDTIEDLFGCAELLAKQPRPIGHGLAIITNAGGPGVVATDALSNYGIEAVNLGSETMKKLDSVLPFFWSHGNPIDILGDASPERYRQAVSICISAPEINALLIILTPQAMTDAAGVAESLAKAIDSRQISVFTVWMGGADVEKGREILNRAKIPTYETPERAIRAFMYMYSYTKNLELLQEIPPKLATALEFNKKRVKEIIQDALKCENLMLDEAESKDLLAAYGIPVNPAYVAATSEEAVKIAQSLGYPVALKIYSKDIIHKSDANGVQLNLHDDKDVEKAFAQIMAGAHDYDPKAELLGVTVQHMLRRPDYELIIGSKKDADFGPIIMFGMGGIMTEILKDQAIALPPLNRLLARRLLESTRVYQLLKGYRNRPPANLFLLEEILIRLSHLITDFPEIIELDINPMILVENQVYAVDARIILKPSEVQAPMHLVISPYPNQYEIKTVTKKNIKIFIRPIKPEDAPLLVDLFYTLSPRNIYMRFFAPLKSLSREMLARLTQIDYDREIALIAFKESDIDNEMIGVARLISDPDGKNAEFSVVVGDPWQGKGVGARLLELSISIAKERMIETIWGMVLAENTTMIALGKKAGFDIAASEDLKEYRLSINLR